MKSHEYFIDCIARKKQNSNNDNKVSKKMESCRCITFSIDGKRIYTGGSSGSLCCIDSQRICTFTNTNDDTSTTKDIILFQIDNAIQKEKVADKNSIVF